MHYYFVYINRENSQLFIEELESRNADYDPGLRDHMTPVLEAIVLKPLNEGEIRMLNK